MPPPVPPARFAAPPPAAPGIFAADVLSASDLTVLSGKRILLLEDEVFIAVDLCHALERAGANVLHARTLSQGLEIIEANEFDAAILDVTLGGADTCAPIANALRRVGTPFVLHSGDLEVQGEVISTLDAPVVAKPAPPEAVVGRLVRLMRDRW